MRGFVAPFRKNIKDLKVNLETTKNILRPQVEKRLDLLDNLSPDAKKANDVLQWLMNNAPPGKAQDVEFHASEQLSLSVASIHNTGMAVS